MLLRSPKNLHYPITVTELLINPNEDVERAAALFAYIYKSVVTEGNQYGEEFQVEKTFPTRFESEAEGTLTAWKIKEGTVIQGPDVDIVEIEEPCRHDVQFGGMCANCGKDMTEADYNTSNPDTTRAVINMLHSNTPLRVSREEAARVEQEAKRRLLKSKKLSLVVDLDQTIIHATVDPTVAEWQRDETNPNYDAVKDVRSFQLVEEDPSRGCWYYIKLRPGLMDFLESISRLYELHIYTMGTRAYAMNIAKIVDPDKKIFGDRILSRDESGSMTAKNLQRLFPVDTKMVVIIDDRGDVWNWSDNLIKVKPYDFFVGIGDINSSFLPRREDLMAPPDRPATNAAPIEAPVEAVSPDPSSLEPASATATALIPSSNGSSRALPTGETSTLDQLVSMVGPNDAASMKEKTTQQDEVIAAQLTDRPLLQKQKALEKYEEEVEEQAAVREQNGGRVDEVVVNSARPRHNLLQDDDEELLYLERALNEVHRLFYDSYEKSLAGAKGGRIAQLRGEKSPKKRPDEDLQVVPDVTDILPPMKQKVLGNIVLTFSGVVPLGTYARNSDLGRWATSFGASINTDVHKNTTHVIASRNRRTAKVRVAARNPKIKIVTTAWLLDSISQWKALREGPYVIEVEPDREHGSIANSNSPLDDLIDGTLSSSEEDAGIVEEDLDSLRKTLHIDTLVGDGAGEASEEAEQSTISPADEITDESWQAMQDEIDNASDDGFGSDTDGDGSASDASQESEKSTKKRKRAAASDDTTDADDSDVSVKGKGSALQMRKRRALQRTSSLTQVATLKLPNGSSGPGKREVLHSHGNTNGTESNGFRWQAETADVQDSVSDGVDAGVDVGVNAAEMDAGVDVGMNAAEMDAGVDAGVKSRASGGAEAHDEAQDHSDTVDELRKDDEDDDDDDDDDGFDAMFAAELDAQMSADSGNDDET